MHTHHTGHAVTVDAHHESEWHLITGWLRAKLSDSILIHRGKVHATDVSSRPEYATYELSNVVVSYPMPTTIQAAHEWMRPNLPWADDHFAERVSGEPLNPAPSHEWWPYAQSSNAMHTDDSGQFSHTYPERIWPKRANIFGDLGNRHNFGIRYVYGDLSDVVSLLKRDPFTRQAFLPIWFPEDTGAVDGQRVPCSIGYHFIRRGTALDCQYFMRSCDLLRFFTDDAYMAVRLTQWICDQLTGVQDWYVGPGTLTMFISNLHAFAGDRERLKRGG